VAQMSETGRMEVMLGSQSASLLSYAEPRGLQDELLTVGHTIARVVFACMDLAQSRVERSCR
jgi:hypothetical protein